VGLALWIASVDTLPTSVDIVAAQRSPGHLESSQNRPVLSILGSGSFWNPARKDLLLDFFYLQAFPYLGGNPLEVGGNITDVEIDEEIIVFRVTVEDKMGLGKNKHIGLSHLGILAAVRLVLKTRPVNILIAILLQDLCFVANDIEDRVDDFLSEWLIEPNIQDQLP
jgi:hypothetical protein